MGFIMDSTKDDDPDPFNKTGWLKGRKQAPILRKSEKKAKIEAITIGKRNHVLS
ncbi:hypothetical protein Bca4012_009274 [Brassica carinata]